MPSKMEKGAGKTSQRAGMFAHRILARSGQDLHVDIPEWQRSTAAVWVGEHLEQSRGLSGWSSQIRGALSEPLAEYLTATVYDWSRHVSVLALSKPEQVQNRFRRLVDEWRRKRGVTSNLTHLVMHSAYQQIIGMGPDAVPFLLRELEQTPDHWFWALKVITGEDPVAETDRGSLKKMTKAWLEWGRKRGYI